MARGGSIDLDPRTLALFNASLKELASAKKVYGVPHRMTRIVNEEMRLLVQRLIEFTPPQTGRGKATTARKLGEGAVSRDIQRVFFSPSRGTGPDVDPSLHQRARRKGRVPPQRPDEPADFASLKAYIRKAQTHVGKAKAGWNAAARKFGVKAAGTWPAWVKRHAGSGRATDNLKSNGDGFLEAVNSDKAIMSLNQRARILNNAMAGRARDMKLKAERILAAAAAKFNKKK